jgi:hypothetical protein
MARERLLDINSGCVDPGLCVFESWTVAYPARKNTVMPDRSQHEFIS